MARPPCRFRYGPTLDNYVDATFPLLLDSVLTWRQASPGSSRVRNAPGVSDGWLTGRDYMLAGNLRWVSPNLWSPGGLGVQGFMDWATGQNAFRFIPDATNESFYVDSCYMEDPFDTWKPSLESANDAQSVSVTIRNATIDFAQLLRGVMFEYLPGTSLTDPLIASVTRASSATQVGRTGLVSTVGNGVLRDAYYEGATRTTRLEPALTQQLLWSEDLTNAAWAKDSGNVTTPSNNNADPAGGTTATRISTTVANQGIFQIGNTNAANGTAATFSVWLRSATNTNVSTVLFIDRSGGFDFETLSVTVTPQWQRFSFTHSTTWTGTTAMIGGIRSQVTTPDILAWGGQLESGILVSSYVKSVGSVGVRSADSLFSFPFTYVPQACTFYLVMQEIGFLNAATFSLAMFLGAAAGTAPRMYVYKSSGLAYAGAVDGIVTGAGSSAGAAPTVGQQIEVCFSIDSAGVGLYSQSINGGTISLGSAQAAVGLPLAWSAATLCFDGSAAGLMSIVTARVAAGVKTMQQMRVL